VRVRRSHERLGSALVQVIQEKPIDEVTAQEVLDRASVGRSTFYVHFRGTDQGWTLKRGGKNHAAFGLPRCSCTTIERASS
jgi:hypothetical protein